MILEATNIKKSYGQADSVLDVLKGIHLNVDYGECIAIVGPSGAGKSTLLHILGGLDEPNDGTVLLEGDDLYQLNDNARAKARNTSIGFVFQFYHLLPEFSALENVLLPVLVKENSGNVSAFHQKAADLLGQVGLEHRTGHKPYQLSGGEQQRVAIARALINEPKIIFCDEPTGNLDSESGVSIIELLLTLNKENKQTLVIVTHDESVASRSHRSVHIRDGEITQ